MDIAELEKLTPHEEIDSAHLNELAEEIKSDDILKFAIVADGNTHMVLDGHHRLRDLKILGCKMIPVIFVDYNSPIIRIENMEREKKIDKGAGGRSGFY